MKRIVVTLRSSGGKRYASQGYDFRLTQWLHPVHAFGHFSWVLLDRDGSVLKTGSSGGAAPDPVTQKQADRMARENIRDYRTAIAMEEKE